MPTLATFKKQTGGIGPEEWFRSLGYGAEWYKANNYNQGKLSLVGPYDYAPRGAQGRSFLIRHQTGIGGTYQDQLRALELPVMFAGRHQWGLNVQGKSVPKSYENMTLQSVVHEPMWATMIINRMLSRRYADKGDYSKWKALVPPWASTVRDELEAQGTRFGIELILDPEVNVSGDPPLFKEGKRPLCLNPLVTQLGANFESLRDLGAEELMRTYYKRIRELNHDD